MTTLVDSIASTIFETEYAMRWQHAVIAPPWAPIVERYRRVARLSIEATAQFIDGMETLSDHDAEAVDWIAGFLRDAALTKAGDGIKEAQRYPATTSDEAA